MDKKEVAKTAATPTPAERFTEMVIKEFAANPGAIELTNFQRKLVQNYFIKLDTVLKTAEVKRLKIPEQKRDALAFTWENVNRNKLAVDVVAYALVGLDPLQPNHINLIPYKNSATNLFDITFMMGYRGIELKAKKYGLDVPDDVIVEVVYENDHFVPIKKDKNNAVETYEFEIKNPFNRGQIVGGFWYHNFFEFPERNKLRHFNMEQIKKRAPEYASPEFWGGSTDVWKGGQKTGEKKAVEGWLDEMVYKTVYRSAYNALTIDSQKIDDHFVKLMDMDREAAEIPQTTDEKVKAEIANEHPTEEISFQEVVQQVAPAAIADAMKVEKPKQTSLTDQTDQNGPGF